MTGPGSDPDPAQVPSVHHCQWCSAPAPADAARCPSCGASLAERESLGDTPIPGVTGVDPSVKASEEFARRQLNRANARSSLLGPAMGGVAGGLLGHVVVSAIQSYAVNKIADESRPAPLPSISLVQLAAKLDRDEQAAKQGHAGSAETEAEAAADTEPATTPDPWADVPAPAQDPSQDPWAGTPSPTPDPWADLPAAEAPVANELTALPGAPGPNELTFLTPGSAAADPWAGASEPWAAVADPWAGASDPWSAGPAPAVDPWATDGGPWSANPSGGEVAGEPPAADDPWTTGVPNAPTDSISSAAPAPERENERR